MISQIKCNTALVYYYIRFQRVWHSLQCVDTVGWATGRASDLKKCLGEGILAVTI